MKLRMRRTGLYEVTIPMNLIRILKMQHGDELLVTLDSTARDIVIKKV